MGLLLKADGTKNHVVPKNGKTFSLKEMQGFVGGYIEMLQLQDGRIMWCNEEGKLKGLPVNSLATSACKYFDTIVGDVLITEPGEVE